MKLLQAGISLVTLLACQSDAFAPNVNLFGNCIKRDASTQSTFTSSPSPSSFPLKMAVMPDAPGPNDWEKSKGKNTDSASPSNPDLSSSFTSDSIPDEMILPFEEKEMSGSRSEERMERMKREADAKSRFLHGDELIELRKYVCNLETDLKQARDHGDITALRDLTKALHESKNMDAEHVYITALENLGSAEREGLKDEAKEFRRESLLARECLPQFQLGGLWVGKYGENGYEMLNVTYIGENGNTLVATKVTGDKNVPKHEITFTADLHPDAKGRSELEAIELSDVASKQWGHKHLPRFPGKGQVAADGFINNQWMDGQLILVGEYFSFAWLPLGHQIFFGRPSAELTLKMLKQSKMADYGAIDKDSPNVVAEQRAFAQRCFDETELMIFDDEGEGEICFLVDDDD